MPLRIVKASEPIEIKNIVLTVYSVPGLGKDSLSYTADDPLLLDFDNGSHRAALRRGDTVQVTSWSDVAGLTADDLEPYKTIAISTGGRAGDILKAHLVNLDPKNGGTYGGMSGKGWANMASTLNHLVSTIRSAGKDLVITMHCDEKEVNGELRERIDAQGAWKNEIYKVSDAMCRIRTDAKGKRFLDFDPSDTGFGKRPKGFPATVDFPHPVDKLGKMEPNPHFLGGVLSQIKTCLNALTAEQADAVAKAEEERQLWEKLFAEADTLDKWNAIPLGLAKERPNTPYSAALKAEAIKRGYTFDASSKLYVAAPEPAKAEVAK